MYGGGGGGLWVSVYKPKIIQSETVLIDVNVMRANIIIIPYWTCSPQAGEYRHPLLALQSTCLHFSNTRLSPSVSSSRQVP